MPRKDIEARKEYAAKYADENAEKLRAYAASYRAKNKELISQKRKAKALENKEYAKSYRETNKANVYKTKKKYVESNRGYINFYAGSRRVAKMNRTPLWLTDFDKLKIKCMYSVASMLTRENKETWHVDHIIPLQGKNVSGLHVPSNLQAIRGEENMAKHNKFEVSHA
jgi:5-methylcytosine-specific restriction endonuclease McrA